MWLDSALVSQTILLDTTPNHSASGLENFSLRILGVATLCYCKWHTRAGRMNSIAAGSIPGNSLSGGFCFISSRTGAVQGTELYIHQVKSTPIPLSLVYSKHTFRHKGPKAGYQARPGSEEPAVSLERLCFPLFFRFLPSPSVVCQLILFKVKLNLSVGSHCRRFGTPTTLREHCEWA